MDFIVTMYFSFIYHIMTFLILPSRVGGTFRLGNRIRKTEIPSRNRNNTARVALLFSEIFKEGF
jgi:hypothetical protein